MNNKTIERIQKLLDRAEGTTFEAEAEACLRKAQQIMSSEGISAADIASKSKDDELGTLGENKLNNGEAKSYFNWKKILLNSLSYFFDCKLIFSSVGSRKVVYTVIGRESNRITFEVMYNWIHDKTMKEARERYGSDTAARNSYCLGVANGISDKIYEMKRKTPATDAWGIVPIDEVRSYIKEHYKNLTKGKAISTNVSDGAAYSSGKKAGSDTSLNRQFGLKRIA